MHIKRWRRPPARLRRDAIRVKWTPPIHTHTRIQFYHQYTYAEKVSELQTEDHDRTDLLIIVEFICIWESNLSCNKCAIPE